MRVVISVRDYLMGRDRDHGAELTDELMANASELVGKVNALLERFGQERKVRSGWRPAAVNAATPNSAPRSKHMTCEAIDLDDPEGDLDDWALENPDALQEIGLWQEHPSATKSWAHFQCVPPKSGKRVFYP